MASDALRHFLRVYDGDLDAPLCQRLIDSFNGLERFQRPNGGQPGFEASAWTELNVTRLSDPGFLGAFRTRIDAALERYNRDVALPIAIPNSPKMSDLVMKRYRPGGREAFQPHFDSIYDMSNRFMVFLWYLNDVAEGGTTVFTSLDGHAVAARQGRLLMFPPYWMYQHAGTPPVSGDKYILSTYLLF